MAVNLGNLTSFIGSSAQTSATYTHQSGANISLLVIRIGLRGISASPNSASVSINGNPGTLVADSTSINSSSRALTAFYIYPNPPLGGNVISISWLNSANVISTALDLSGAAFDGLTSVTTNGNSSSTLLSILCPQDGIVLDSIDANNDRTFSPLYSLTPHYATLSTSTGNSDVTHRAGYKFGSGTLSMGWSISSASNYVYSLIAVPPSLSPPPGGSGSFLFFFGQN